MGRGQGEVAVTMLTVQLSPGDQQGAGTEWATCRSAVKSPQVRMEGAQVRTVGSSGATVRGRPLLTPPGSGKPPGISVPDQYSTLGQLSRVGILSVLVCLKFSVEGA